MKVRAAQGLKVPTEDRPRKYITETEAIEVADTAYYTRLVSDGSLVFADGFKSEVTDGQ